MANNSQQINNLLLMLAQNRAQAQQQSQNVGGGGGSAAVAGLSGTMGVGGAGASFMPSSASVLPAAAPSGDVSNIRPTSSGIIAIGDTLSRYQRARAHGESNQDTMYRGRDFSPMRGDDRRDNSTVSETLVMASNYVGKVIGRGGDTMRRIEQDSGARVQFTPEKESRPGERVANITGTRYQVDTAKNAILELIGGDARLLVDGRLVPASNRSSSHYSNDFGRQTAEGGEEKFTFTVPNHCVGLIIGRGGEKVNEIQKKTGARVSIAPENESINGYRPINLFGAHGANAWAKQLIDDIVNLEQDNIALSSYGSASSGMAKSRLSGAYSQNLAAGETSVTIKVRHDSVGALIGKGGEAIKELQNKSGAHIHVAPEPHPSDTTHREVTLVGLPDSIQRAQALIDSKMQQSVSEAHNLVILLIKKTSNTMQSSTMYTGSQPMQGQMQTNMNASLMQATGTSQSQDPYAAFGGYEAVAAYWASQAAFGKQNQPFGGGT